MERPLISIIIPCYNAEEYLQEAVQSVLKQIYPYWELLLIDDGSKDSTPQMCDEFAAKDMRVKVIHKKNGGVSSARNMALEKVKGEWLTFLDSDDWFEEDTLITFLLKMEDNDLVQFNHYYNYPHKQVQRKPFSPNPLVRSGKQLNSFLFDLFTPYYDECRNSVSVGAIRGVWGKFFKTSIIREHKIQFVERLTIAEDALFCYDYIRRCKTVSLFNEYKLHYRVNGASIMQGYKADIEEINNEVLKAYVERSNTQNAEYQAVLTAVLAECMFRTFKLKYFHEQSSYNLREIYEATKRLLESDWYKKILSFNNHSVLPRGKKEMVILANKRLVWLLMTLQYAFVKIKTSGITCGKNFFPMSSLFYIKGNLEKKEQSHSFNVLKKNNIYDSTPPRKILISVIVPCYNVEEYIAETVESIVKQSYPYWELLLVDDGSKDRTPQMCDEFASKDDRIKVIHKKNGGLVSARNAGYDAAQGEWQMYLDGDDWIDTDTCEKLVAYLQRYPDVDIVFWKCIQELYGKSITGKWEWTCTDKERLYSGKECHELAKHTLIYKSGIATAYCKLIRSDYAKRCGIKHDDRLRQGAEGMEFSLRAFYHTERALYVNEYFNHYRYNPNSISKRVDERNTKYLADCFDVVQEDINSFEDKEMFLRPLYQRTVYVLIAIAMSTYFHPGNKDGLFTKIRKYAKLINDSSLFTKAVKECDTEGMDKQRRITLWFIRHRYYFVLSPIAQVKQYYLKKGKYNY